MGINGKTRTATNYPVGFHDVLEIERTGEYFRLLMDPKGRFIVHRISKEEASYKLCRVRRIGLGKKGLGYLLTHDGRSLRDPDPNIQVGDTVIVRLETYKIIDYIKF